jgi:hypothetical protein
MKKSILFASSLMFLSINSIADEIYFVDTTGDVDILGQGGWMFAEDSAFITKSEITKEPTVEKIEKKPIEIKIEYKDADTSECKSIKKRCASSR